MNFTGEQVNNYGPRSPEGCSRWTPASSASRSTSCTPTSVRPPTCASSQGGKPFTPPAVVHPRKELSQPRLPPALHLRRMPMARLAPEGEFTYVEFNIDEITYNASAVQHSGIPSSRPDSSALALT